MNAPLEVLEYNAAGAEIARERRLRSVIEMPKRAPADPNAFPWTREHCIGLAATNCVHCKGIGMKAGRNFDRLEPCKCVLRRIFRICLNRYRQVQTEVLNESARLGVGTPTSGGRRSSNWGYKGVEFCSDFTNLAQRALEGLELETFRLHFLYGRDYRLCCRELKLDKGQFFHSIYRIEAKLGRLLIELKPYALFPLDEYFGGVKVKTRATPVLSMPARRRFIVPLRTAAAA